MKLLLRLIFLVSAIKNENFPDFEDCLQEKCAVAVRADFVVTNNVKDFKTSVIPAVTPSEMLAILFKMRVELFPFQQKAVKNLRMFVAVSKASYPLPQVISFTAPTGAGKTIMTAEFVESVYCVEENYPVQNDAIFVWLSDSPELNCQS